MILFPKVRQHFVLRNDCHGIQIPFSFSFFFSRMWTEPRGLCCRGIQDNEALWSSLLCPLGRGGCVTAVPRQAGPPDLRNAAELLDPTSSHPKRRGPNWVPAGLKKQKTVGRHGALLVSPSVISKRLDVTVTSLRRHSFARRGFTTLSLSPIPARRH